MSEKVAWILERTLLLTEQDRSEIAYRLLETLSEPTDDVLSASDPGLLAKLDRRFSDTEGSLPWSEVRDQGPAH